MVRLATTGPVQENQAGLVLSYLKANLDENIHNLTSLDRTSLMAANLAPEVSPHTYFISQYCLRVFHRTTETVFKVGLNRAFVGLQSVGPLFTQAMLLHFDSIRAILVAH